jgi:cold shock CspA family protein
MSSDKRQVGQVKWFNNKAGYGFITIKEEDVSKDIFTHYSTIQVTNSQYKYLVQGEYVEFDLVNSTNDKHEVQAVNVTGINGGSLMCETRSVNYTPSTTQDGTARVTKRRPISARKPRTDATEDDSDFKKVEGKSRSKVAPK